MNNDTEKIKILEQRIKALEARFSSANHDSDIEAHIKRLKSRKKELEDYIPNIKNMTL